MVPSWVVPVLFRVDGTGPGIVMKRWMLEPLRRDSMTDPSKTAEREAAWRQIYVDIMDDAPWGPCLQ